MEELNKEISILLDKIIATEELIGDELRSILQSFKTEKETLGFHFGTLCIIHYEEYADHFNQDIYKIAAAIELLILSFDIIDDLQDHDSDYLWVKTPELSLNAVLAMMMITLKVMRQSHFEHRELAFQIIEEYTLLSINGQQLDLLNICQDESSYLQMIEQKSGSLTAMSCLVGFTLACGEKSVQVEQYAKSIGVIQQIKNDIQDLKEWDCKNDLLNRKYSLPIIYLFSLTNDISEEIKKYYAHQEEIILAKPNIIEALTNSGAIRYALAIKNLYRNQALTMIQNINMNAANKEYLKKIMK
ncbi:polyprenyl synthetase family protein [Lysinibacillus sp. LZ02]|uniref:polyprenyl synthetase family protein n=1 Tax=Lysinibacillus sp. LZ02 TaxID=3420668 RepID=UPI003D3646DF